MNVLLAHDGSDHAETAVKLAASLAWPAGTRILVVRVQDTSSARPALTEPFRLDTYLKAIGRLLRDAEAQVARASATLAGPGREVTTAVKEGRPASVIVAEAQRMKADLVMVGSRGRGVIASTVLGSVAAEVVDHAPCPVLVARAGSLSRLVLAEDGSDGARKAAETIARWPILKAATVRVVSVLDISLLMQDASGIGGMATEETYDTLRDANKQLAADSVARLAALGMQATFEVRLGFVGKEIIDAARDAGAELIVMGSRGRTGLARMLLGSVARSVLHHAPCSVLIVRGRVAGRV